MLFWEVLFVYITILEFVQPWRVFPLSKRTSCLRTMSSALRYVPVAASSILFEYLDGCVCVCVLWRGARKRMRGRFWPHWLKPSRFFDKKLNEIASHDVATAIGIRKVGVAWRVGVHSPVIKVRVRVGVGVTLRPLGLGLETHSHTTLRYVYHRAHAPVRSHTTSL